jgi:hypothetical protein
LAHTFRTPHRSRKRLDFNEMARKIVDQATAGPVLVVRAADAKLTKAKDPG